MYSNNKAVTWAISPGDPPVAKLASLLFFLHSPTLRTLISVFVAPVATEYYEQLYANKRGILEETDKVLET